jgi:carboxypeptidase Q
MLRMKFTVALLVLSLLLPGVAFGQMTPTVNSDVAKIIDEGMKRSKAMETLNYLTDVIGPRLTNSPSQRRANEWTKNKLTEWGIQNAKVEAWGTFGRGWTLKKYTASLVEPEQIPFHSYPKAWSPSTNGVVTGDVIYMDVKTEADLEKYRGKLKGAIIFLSAIREVKPGFEAVATRHDDKSLLALANAAEQAQTGQGGFRPTAEMMAAAQLNNKRIQMAYEEGAAVLVEASQLDAGTIRVMGASGGRLARMSSSSSSSRRLSKAMILASNSARPS